LANQGVTLMVIADQTNDAAVAEAALRQIEVAYEVMRSGGQEQWSAFYSAQLRRAQAILKGKQ
jgi:hypothetical protein